MSKYMFFIFIFFFSCNRNEQYINNKDINSILNKSFKEFYDKKDKKILEQAYDSLQKNKDFQEKGLIGKNSLPIISLLMLLQKYDELENLLEANKTLNRYNRINTLNMVRSLKYSKKDRSKSDLYIYESINMIRDSLQKAPNDSILYADYFTMRMYLNGKVKALQEIDSMQKVDKRYTELFYNKILKESIEEYPLELLP